MTEPKRRRTHRMVIVSDLHAGFKYGPLPPGWRLIEGDARDPLQKFQAYLFDCWSHFVETCPRCEVLVLNGEAIHGEDVKDRGLNVVSTDPLTQSDIAIDLLRPLRKKVKRFWIVRGTPYHEGPACQAIERVAAELNAECWSKDRRSGVSLHLDWHGRTLGFAHHMTKGWIYQAGGLERTIMMQILAESRSKQPHTDILVRSHLHGGRYVYAHGKLAIATPAWTVVSPYAERKMELSRAWAYNDIGGTILTLSDDTLPSIHFEEYVPLREEVRGT